MQNVDEDEEEEEKQERNNKRKKKKKKNDILKKTRILLLWTHTFGIHSHKDLRHCSTLSPFKAKLKTFLFSQYFHPN